MHLKPARNAAAVAAIGGVLVLGLGSAQAAKASPMTSVACSVPDLVTAISGGGTLDLTSRCTYHVQGTLTVSSDTTIYGDGATIEGGGPSAHFTIMTVDSAVDVTLDDVNFTDGVTDNDGGAIESNGDLTIDGGTFSHNSATVVGYHGGAINAESGSLTINDAVFTDNDGWHGGAIRANTGVVANITGTQFSQNKATQGGAIFNYSGVHVAGSTFIMNTAADGGAIYDQVAATLTNSQIVLNTATTEGGGIYQYCSSATLSGTISYGNVPDNSYSYTAC